MNRLYSTALACLLAASAFAQDAPKVELHGFIRNFATLDSRECISGTEDFFMYMPRDVKMVDGEDLYAQPTHTFSALTSRLWVEAKGYEYMGWKMAARVEADFYLGLSKAEANAGAPHTVDGAASMRLRQAFVTARKGINSFKMGQAWHPVAADMPDIFSLNVGAPFGPFSRTPLLSWDIELIPGLSQSASLIAQQQYTSAGPLGASAIYQVYACNPEFYDQLTYTSGPFLARLGGGVLHLRPRINNGSKKVSDNITTLYSMLYLQYKKNLLSVKAKSVYAEAGEHIGLNGGYGISNVLEDGSYEYTPTRSLSSWLSVAYGKKVQAVLFAGYMKEFGTACALAEEIKDDVPTGKALGYYYNKNALNNLNSMWRVAPQIIWNCGRLQLGAEYELTGVLYGDKAMGMNLATGLYDKGLHTVCNNRLQTIVKFTF